MVCLLTYSNKDKIKDIFNENMTVSASEKDLIQEPEVMEMDTEKIATSQFLDEPEESTDVQPVEDTAVMEELDIKALYPVEITDIYTESGETVEFISFYPDAEGYAWEVYDMDQKAWIPAESTAVSAKRDELYREVSVFRISAGEGQDTSMIRCTITLEDGSSQTDTASLYVLSKKIGSLKVNDTEVSKCGYVNTLEIPVTVIYEDGTSEELTGLYGLKFLCSKRTIEYDESETGNLIEKRIDTVTECDYTFLESGGNEKTIRYKNLREEEFALQITGCDKEPPVISDVVIGDYLVSKENKAVSLQVEIYAEDNDTPYPYLEYAFAHESMNVDEIEFVPENELTVLIDKNGEWISYVRDQSGNIAQLAKELITVDQLAPSLTANLKETSWCRENVISVVGKDRTSLVYQVLKGNECIYDWTKDTSFTVSENGIYIVKAKDEAGNETVLEVVVENIDLQAPVITNIKEGGNYSNEN